MLLIVYLLLRDSRASYLSLPHAMPIMYKERSTSMYCTLTLKSFAVRAIAVEKTELLKVTTRAIKHSEPIVQLENHMGKQVSTRKMQILIDTYSLIHPCLPTFGCFLSPYDPWWWIFAPYALDPGSDFLSCGNVQEQTRRNNKGFT